MKFKRSSLNCTDMFSYIANSKVNEVTKSTVADRESLTITCGKVHSFQGNNPCAFHLSRTPVSQDDFSYFGTWFWLLKDLNVVKFIKKICTATLGDKNCLSSKFTQIFFPPFRTLNGSPRRR